MSDWVVICECGHTAGAHAYRDDATVVCIDVDCPCRRWTPGTMVWPDV